MKKLITITLILALLLPVAVLAEAPDPIVGAWYMMLDYRQGPQTAETKGKKLMILIMIFEEDGTLSWITSDSDETNGIVVQGETVGTWSRNGNNYNVNIIGTGTNRAELTDDRLLVEVMQNAWYTMRPMELGSWYSDVVFRLQ